MCREILFSWRPLLSFCCGLLVGFIQVQDDIIVQAGGGYCIKILHEIHSLHARTSAQHIATEFQKSSYSWFGFLHRRGYILQCLISGHVTTMLFIRLQKLNTAMPPCRPSSAAGRGKTWKGKAKARKTQVAGKGQLAPRGQENVDCHFATLQRAAHNVPTECVKG